MTYKFGDSSASDDAGGEFGRIIVTFVDALRRNTDQDRLAFGVRTLQRDAALVHVRSATSADFLHVDLVTTFWQTTFFFTPVRICLLYATYDVLKNFYANLTHLCIIS